MERNEISVHEARAFVVLRKEHSWITSKELAERAEIAGRTARSFMLKFVRLGIVDIAEVFPGHRYRLSEKARSRNAAYFQRLEMALDVFGLAT